MVLVGGEPVRRAARRTAGLALGGAGAFAELGFLLVAVPALAVPPLRERVFGAAGAIAGFERRRIERYLGQACAEGCTGRRAVQYLGVRWVVGGLGAGVLLLVLLGAVSAVVMVAQVLAGGAPGSFDAADGLDWYDPFTFVLFGTLLVFITVQGLIGVAGLDRRLARHFFGPTARELLRRRVSELTVSRAEVVAAVDEERRRIERDLHDGVQQRLVALGVLLGRAARASGRTGAGASIDDLLRQAHEETGRALLDLREVAWRIHPVALDSGGLHPALEALAETAGVPVRLVYSLAERPPGAVEVPAYFVACEAVTNANKHAAATRIDLAVSHTGSSVVVRVADDGVGGADPAGSGLSGLARRVAAVDGVFTVDSPPGGPTVVTAELPCG
ncbi:histidine kinase [Actinokineospora sp. PR83]|uniref:sensor histidine kinase n=1 Tax=Actinokineospora sp. PR83 TaxID=2884908 RepID=UPI001F2885FB|nr:histidine kinase [Actinokineospora sp. PR83]MCG8918333.1 histidine kinase [Actinokineospora sp. PR83]